MFNITGHYFVNNATRICIIFLLRLAVKNNENW